MKPQNLQAVVPKNQLQISVLDSYSAKLWGRQACDCLRSSLLYQALVQVGVNTTRKGSSKLDQPCTNVFLQKCRMLCGCPRFGSALPPFRGSSPQYLEDPRGHLLEFYRQPNPLMLLDHGQPHSEWPADTSKAAVAGCKFVVGLGNDNVCKLGCFASASNRSSL